MSKCYFCKRTVICGECKETKIQHAEIEVPIEQTSANTSAIFGSIFNGQNTEPKIKVDVRLEKRYICSSCIKGLQNLQVKGVEHG